jgi:tetratricopeptide (TPR) repeat protein
MKLFKGNSQEFTVVYAELAFRFRGLANARKTRLGGINPMTDSKEVTAALDRILATPAFARSPRLARFLQFAVQERLSSRPDSPKECEIGMQVFGRPPGYDCRIDPVVRVQARLLRFKLHEYYETVGRNDPWRIELPKGMYLASFVGQMTPEPVPSVESHSQIPLRWIAALVVTVVFAMFLISWGAGREAVGKVWTKTLPVRPKAAQSVADDLYLKGRYYWNKRTPADLQKAVDYFTQSIVADPGYAKAYVGLADCYGLQREFAAMPDSEAWPRALAAARRAVELDNSLAEAHSSLGFDLFYGMLDLKGGEREFKRAVELNPKYAEAHQWYATALMSMGRFQQASDEMERARQLQPTSRSLLADQGLLLFYEGKHEHAIEQLRQIEAAEPTFRSAHVYLAYIYFVSKDCPNYLSELRKAAESSRDPVELAVAAETEQDFAAGSSQSMFESLLKIQKKFANEGRYQDFRVAETSAMLGRKRDALDYLDASYKKREFYMTTLAADPAFLSLRTEPAFQNLLSQLGLDARN